VTGKMLGVATINGVEQQLSGGQARPPSGYPVATPGPLHNFLPGLLQHPLIRGVDRQVALSRRGD